jgi:exodeoxyribonuclease V beta subunit
MTTSDATFSVVGELPTGRTAIEASAGTGKTYTLAALATRLVAERDVTAGELLIVTFTRAATAELRGRVRERLAGAAAHLAHDEPPPTDDDVLTLLASVDPSERRLRAKRLARAVSEFDAATITTIHGFATQVLGTLGAASGADRDATLVDDEVDLTSETCADVLAAAATLGHLVDDLPSFRTLVTTTRTALHSPDVVVAPGHDEDGASAAHRLLAELVVRACDELVARRRRAGTMSFDDILRGLRAALASDDNAGAIAALRKRYRAALIDEFQDTDPVQWEIFRTLFGAGGLDDTLLVLVGDPKQAIYSFRGADIHTYVGAVDPASGVSRGTLGINWRSDGRLLDALDVLFEGATFGDPTIAFSTVETAPVHRGTAIVSADDPERRLPAVSLRLATRPDLPRGKRGTYVKTDDAERDIYLDLAGQVIGLLDGAMIPDPESGTGALRRVEPHDVAVLVKTSAEAESIQQVLIRHGVPAVLARGGSVLQTPAALQWRWLLDAMLRPSDPRRVRTFALSWFGGWTPARVDTATDAELADLAERLHRWGGVLVEHGPVELVRRVWAESGVVARVLGRPDGDRALTDLDHLGELLAASPSSSSPNVAGLLAVLGEDPEPDVDPERDTDVAARRIESEADAVQIMTVWVAKGLEFPIVCVPTMWRGGSPRPVIVREEDGRRTFDVSKGGPWPDKDAGDDRKRRSADEDAGEMLRLLYVAATRAQHQAVIWWAPGMHAPASPLARLLFARHDDGTIDLDHWNGPKVTLPPDEQTLEALGPLLARGKGTIAAEVYPEPVRGRRWHPRDTDSAEVRLRVARLDREPDRTRRRWSFTSITAHDDHRGLDPMDPWLGDGGAADEQHPPEPDPSRDADGEPLDLDLELEPEPPPPPAVPASVDGPDGPVVAAVRATPFAVLPAGAAFGSLVHAVLEQTDFTDPDLAGSMDAVLDDLLVRFPVDLTPDLADGTAAPEGDGRALLLGGLADVLDTPLGSRVGGVRLRDVPRADRLDELAFELHLAGGPAPVDDRAIGRLVRRHLPADDVLAPWAESVAEGRFHVDLAGHLTGSIDLVLRLRDPDGTPRFVVVDYKTNRLHPRGTAVQPRQYGRTALASAMADHHYPLQSLLYAVALHRYLRWRQPGYDPARHLGGAAYLFVRGMTGADAPVDDDGRTAGVFDWAIPPALVVELSDLLDGRPPAAPAGPGEQLTLAVGS